MIQKAILKECLELQKTRFALYAGYTVFIIDRKHVIIDDEIFTDFDVDEYKKIFKIIKTVE